MTTGMPLVVTAAMKPIPTLMQPLQTVNLDTLEVAQASKERSDVCAVPAAAVVAEGEVAFALADAICASSVPTTWPISRPPSKRTSSD